MKSKHMTHKIGLVLSGGGGKGAYEVGVWKALEEFGIAENISVISGSSVGALNAVLFAQDHSSVAEEVWNSIGPPDILHIDFEKYILPRLLGLMLPQARVTILLDIFSRGVFSRQGLSRILDSYFDINRLRASNRKVYAACTRIAIPPESDVFLINEASQEKAKKILLASSALPLVFGGEKIDGNFYYDGGIMDNTPVVPVCREGCNLIIAVFLSQSDYVEAFKYPDAKFIYIYPQQDMGGVFDGILNFSSPQQRIRQGYEDICKIIGPAYDLAKSQFRIGQVLEQIKRNNQQFRNYLSERERLFTETDDAINNLRNIIKRN